MNIDMSLLKHVVNDFIKYNGLDSHVFVSCSDRNGEIILTDTNNMELFKHYLINCAIHIMIEWYYDLNEETNLNDERYLRNIRCYMLDKIDNFPYKMGYWID